jgi:hypothetical protein
VALRQDVASAKRKLHCVTQPTKVQRHVASMSQIACSETTLHVVWHVPDSVPHMQRSVFWLQLSRFARCRTGVASSLCKVDGDVALVVGAGVLALVEVRVPLAGLRAVLARSDAPRPLPVWNL